MGYLSIQTESGKKMSLYNLEQYLTDSGKTLDLSDIITRKLLLNGRYFEFAGELNQYIADHPRITQLIIKSSLLQELIGIDSTHCSQALSEESKAVDSTGCPVMPVKMGNIRKLKIKAEQDIASLAHWYSFGRSFFFFLRNNRQLQEIDCRNDTLTEMATIDYPSRDPSQNKVILKLRYSGKYSDDTSCIKDLLFPCGIHLGLLQYYYGMTIREIAIYYEWLNLKEEDAVVKGMLPSSRRVTGVEDSWVGLKAKDPLMFNQVSIPKIDLPHPAPIMQQEPLTRLQTIRAVFQPTFLIELASTLFKEARQPKNLCIISILVSSLITISLPVNVTLAASIGVVSAIGFYAVGRHSILPTRENAMQPYDSILGPYRIG